MKSVKLFELIQIKRRIKIMVNVISKVLMGITYGNYWMIRILLFTPLGSCYCTSIKNLTNKLSEVFDSVLSSFEIEIFFSYPDKIASTIRNLYSEEEILKWNHIPIEANIHLKFVARNLKQIEFRNSTTIVSEQEITHLSSHKIDY